MRTLRLTLGLLLGLLVAPLPSEAQQTKRVYTIGFLTQAACPTPPYTEDPFRQMLRDLGYIEGQNIVIECRGAAGQTDRLLDLAAELVRLKVDVLVTQGTLPALAAKRATPAIPIVFSVVADAVATGLVTSLARPGGHITGLSIFGTESIPKQLELLKEAAPWISRVALLGDLSNPGVVAEFTLHDAVANVLRLTVQRLDVRSPADLDGAFAAALQGRAQALLLAPLAIRRADAERIMEFAVKNRSPTIGNVSRLLRPKAARRTLDRPGLRAGRPRRSACPSTRSVARGSTSWRATAVTRCAWSSPMVG
jgi:ABC-type uncharacterized transport system substrate-binding protein